MKPGHFNFVSSATISLVFCILFCLPVTLLSQQRDKVSINDAWEFVKSSAASPDNVNWGDLSTEKVSLPYTWNDTDVLDETPGYYRGSGWYKKRVKLNEGWEKKKLYLEFEAANQVAEVFINGSFTGAHNGGYSGFRFDITDYINHGETDFDLCVRVDNSFNEDIPPLTADFTFFGGIYRDAWLIYAPEVHFSLDHFGGPGVYWQTPSVDMESAEVKIYSFVSNCSDRKARYRLEHILIDEHGLEIESVSVKQSVQQGKDIAIEPLILTVEAPSLWSVEKPVTYSLVSSLIDRRTGDIVDKEINPIGFRWYSFSAEEGFSLNGNPMKIHGISRHQDYPGKGNALQTDQHVEDMLSIKNLGANFLRIAHYPQDQDVIVSCDTLGILTSVEIPIVNRITESDDFERNSLLMMEEMIWQNYNHPSLIMWTYMNEVLLRPPFLDEPERLQVYYSNVAALAEKLEQKARKLDPFRVTMIPNHGAFSRYNDAGLTKIPMVVGWNLYNGWYGSGFKGFGKFLDRHHQDLPDKPLLVTEFGAGHDPRLTSFNAERFDFTAEYAMRYHRNYNEEIEKRDFVSGGLIWILNDFSSEGRGDAVPHINSKGICDIYRVPKESYWFYKSIWSKKPFVKIWMPYPSLLISENTLSDKKQDAYPVRIYTNIDSINILLNGRNFGIYQSNSGMLEVDLPLEEKENHIRVMAVNGDAEQTLVFDFIKNSGSFLTDSEAVDLHISCGDHRYFLDESSKKLWLPDRPYIPGSWGYIGGEAYTVKTRHGLKPSSDKQIFDTALDPVFQTQQLGPESYRFDVPPGRYEVSLHFAELSSSSEAEALAYNLGDDAVSKGLQKRVFSVEINGKSVLSSFNLHEISGSYTAVIKKYEIDVKGEEGIKIVFIKEQGDAIISGIEIQSSDMKQSLR